MLRIVFSLFLISSVVAQCLEETTGWIFHNSVNQSIYMFESMVFMNSILAYDQNGDVEWGESEDPVVGDGTTCETQEGSSCFENPGTCDVIGAFTANSISQGACDSQNGGIYDAEDGVCHICIAWNYVDEGGYTTVTAQGSDPGWNNDDSFLYYPSDGDEIVMVYFDASSAEYYDLYLLDTNGEDLALNPWGPNLAMNFYCIDGSQGCASTEGLNVIPLSLMGLMPLDNNSLGATTPREFGLTDIYPNPFNPSTSINFSLSDLSAVKIQVYDVNGRFVSTLLDSYRGIGDHSVVWIPDQNVSSGSYFISFNRIACFIVILT